MALYLLLTEERYGVSADVGLLWYLNRKVCTLHVMSDFSARSWSLTWIYD